MVTRLRKLAILAGMLLAPASWSWADDPASAVRGLPWAAPQPAPPVTASGIVRLPPTGTAMPVGGSAPGAPAGPGPAIDGTYREDGQFVTININGKEMRLIKPPSEIHASSVRGMAEGTVRGRLMQNGRPLADCRVVIVPLEGQGKAYRYDVNREPMSTVANAEGIYDFDHVPIGKYKLTWLPVGTNQWIRKIAIKPDVVVRPGQAVTVNTIGMARQTIN